MATPPYWNRYKRSSSDASSTSAQTQPQVRPRPDPIILEDHTRGFQYEPTNGLWAKGVTIDDYTIVSGNSVGAGSYVVWQCAVETLDGGPVKIRKRYSEFDSLRQRLLATFPNSEGSIPKLPPKSFISRFRPRFLARRKEGLAYFLNCILLNPEFAGAPVLKEFIFS